MKKLKHGIHELHFEVTGNCNLECIYCYNYDCRDKTDELTLDEIKKLFKDTDKYGTKVYTLTGGEPFVRPDFFEILKELKGKYVAILSNGKLIDEPLIKKIKGDFPQVKEFKISLDGFEAHNKMRVGSNWKTVVNTIKLLKKHYYRVVVNTIVLEPNQKELYKLYSLLNKLKVDRWRVDMPFNLGNYLKNNNQYLPPNPKVYTKMFAKIIKEHEKTKNKMVLEIFNLYKSQFTPTNTIDFEQNVHPCEYKRELISMKPDGKVIFCPSLSFAMANYREEGTLKNVFKKEETHPFYSLKMSDLVDCQGCRYLRICGGGCRANAIYDFSEWNKRDLSACVTFPFWEKEILPILQKSHRDYFSKLINKKGFIPNLEKNLLNLKGGEL